MAEALTLEQIEALEHDFYGPTWTKDDDGNWLLPEKTLGWDLAGWCAKYLQAKGGGPWQFTMEQMRFILWWYAVDETGDFIYRTGVLQRMKGWGKDPLLAVMCMIELCAPSRFSHWDKNNQPVGKPVDEAWIQVSAVNQSQTTNTMALFPSLVSDLAIKTYGIEIGAMLMRARGGRRLEAVTSSYRAMEGKRTTFTLLNETHHWVSGNQGHKMYETIRGNIAKTGSRFLAITNAYLPGEDSVAERMREGWEKVRDGRSVDTGFLYDSIEAHPQTPLTADALTIVIPKIRGDAVWLSVKAILAEVMDVTVAPSRSRRMWLNQIVTDEDALYDAAQWRPLGDDTLTLLPGDEITLGFDGGKTDDATVLVALRCRDKAAFLLHIQEKPDDPEMRSRDSEVRWEVNRDKVDSAVHHAFRVYKVLGFYADVALWESHIGDWAEQYGEGLIVKAEGRNPIAWDMRQSLQRVTRAHERLMQAIFDAKIKHDNDPTMTRHVLNARRRENQYGLSFGKESRESPRKVDAYAALLLAHEADYDRRARGKKADKPRVGYGFFM